MSNDEQPKISPAVLDSIRHLKMEVGGIGVEFKNSTRMEKSKMEMTYSDGSRAVPVAVTTHNPTDPMFHTFMNSWNYKMVSRHAKSILTSIGRDLITYRHLKERNAFEAACLKGYAFCIQRFNMGIALPRAMREFLESISFKKDSSLLHFHYDPTHPGEVKEAGWSASEFSLMSEPGHPIGVCTHDEFINHGLILSYRIPPITLQMLEDLKVLIAQQRHADAEQQRTLKRILNNTARFYQVELVLQGKSGDIEDPRVFHDALYRYNHPKVDVLYDKDGRKLLIDISEGEGGSKQ